MTIPKSLSVGEETLAFHLQAQSIHFQREFLFSLTRKWRADFYIPEINLLIEVEGGIWAKGGHSTGKGITRDIEKSNDATLLGYRLLRYTPEMVKSGKAIDDVMEILGGNLG